MDHATFRQESALMKRQWDEANKMLEGKRIFQSVLEAKHRLIRDFISSFESFFLVPMDRCDSLYNTKCKLNEKVGGLEEKK